LLMLSLVSIRKMSSCGGVLPRSCSHCGYDLLMAAIHITARVSIHDNPNA
jgi:hypothetical protein